MIGKAIFAMLSTNAEVESLVGDRIYPSVSPDNIYPLIVYDVAEEPSESIDVQELTEFTVTLTLVTRSYASAQELAKVVKCAMDRQKGMWGGLFIRSCNLIAPTSESSYTDSANVEITYHTQEQQYRVWCKPLDHGE
jgi:hypothetical protein